MIPTKNVRNLMLEQEIVAAVKDGKFNIWPVATIEEGIEILTGMAAGELQEDGTYPEGTLFHKVDERLTRISEIVRQFGKDNGEAKKKDEEPSGCSGCGA